MPVSFQTVLRAIADVFVALWKFVRGFSENFFEVIPDKYIVNVWIRLAILAAIAFITFIDPYGLVSKFSGLALFVSGICAFGNEIWAGIMSLVQD
jgi:hypothetical protein|tara:strand:+ start:1486 stop:1770 length:285 start_codon:yes stop_codon:yes gene_type:complete